MARARNIKPGFYKNEDLAECSIWARYIFPGLWMLADREGRLEDRPKRIKGELLPFDSQDVEPLLRELADRGFIVRYKIDGASFIQISKFSEHQAPHYSEKASVIKPHYSEKPIVINPPLLQEHSKGKPAIKRGSQPPDSLIPDSLIPEKSLVRASRGARLSLESLPAEWRDFCAKERTDLVPEETFNRFRDYWIAKPGRDGLKVDWLATWRNWVRNEKHEPREVPRAAPVVMEPTLCPCGAPATMKVGGKWRCASHVREDFSTAAKAA